MSQWSISKMNGNDLEFLLRVTKINSEGQTPVIPIIGYTSAATRLASCGFLVKELGGEGYISTTRGEALVSHLVETMKGIATNFPERKPRK